MPQYKIVIPGVPLAQHRPRFARRGKFVVAYSDQQTEAGRWLLTARQQIVEKVPEGVPIALDCMFYMPIPKSLSRKQVVFHIKKPDLSNLIKFAEDCLNGEAWHDDSQISEINSAKSYSQNPRTTIIIQW